MDKVTFQFDLPSDLAHELINFCIEKDITISELFGGSAIVYLLEYEKFQLRKTSD